MNKTTFPMFTKAKNINGAFRSVKILSFYVIALSVILCLFSVWKAFDAIETAQHKIYILSSGNALTALRSDRRENLPVELRNHVLTFHNYFFSLSPDEKYIEQNISKALYLADGSAKKQYDDLTEQGYYRGVISGNISQSVQSDSISLDMTMHPLTFRFHGKLQITRPTSIVTRSLITEGRLREVARSEHNPHGFLIERWTVLENRDLSVSKR